MADNKVTNVYLVAAGDYHDIDFARLELLKLLAEHESVRCQVAADYHDLEAIAASDFLITYTCNLVPTEAEQLALKDYIAGGKRWFALHGTNSILKFLEDGRVDAPEIAPVLMEVLGTQFMGHPPIQPFKVDLAVFMERRDHGSKGPAVRGLWCWYRIHLGNRIPLSRNPAVPSNL